MSNQNKGNNTLMRYLGLGTQWMVMLLAAVFIGYKIDERMNITAFIIVLPLVALIVSLWQLIKEFNKPEKK